MYSLVCFVNMSFNHPQLLNGIFVLSVGTQSNKLLLSVAFTVDANDLRSVFGNIIYFPDVLFSKTV